MIEETPSLRQQVGPPVRRRRRVPWFAIFVGVLLTLGIVAMVGLDAALTAADARAYAHAKPSD